MLTFAQKYGGNVYSQFGEDFIINEILIRIGKTLGVCVEFGGHNGTFCSNTRRLIDMGWTGYMYDIEPSNDLVIKKEITVDNINELPACDVLSIDVDGKDYGLWEAYNGKPDIVIIEINSSIHPMNSRPLNDPQHGTVYKQMVRLGIIKGYFLAAHTGNCIFVLNEHRALFPEILGNGVDNWAQYFNTSHLPAC